MRKLILSGILSVMVLSNVGSFVPIYSGAPAERTRQLLFTSEDFRMLRKEWERFWFLDQPSHLTTQRLHGGVI